MNAAAKAAAKPDSSYWDALGSGSFALAFCIGISSLLAMVAVYQGGLSLARGILFMGAVSIVVGSIVGMVRDGELLAIEELFLLAAIAALFVYRWIKWPS